MPKSKKLLFGLLLTGAVVVTSAVFIFVPVLTKPSNCEGNLIRRQYASRYFRQVIQMNADDGKTHGDFQVATKHDLLAGSPSWNSANELYGEKKVSFFVYKHKSGAVYVVFETSTGIVLDSGKL